MYIPKHFEIEDREEISRFIESNSFGQLISLQDGSLVSTHLPFLFDADNHKLLAHLARGNPQWQQIDGQNILVTLQGEHAYVSPSWYESTGVPTWNYQSVHIEGVAQRFDDPEKLKFLVDKLTELNEAAYDSPWTPDYAVSMLRGIVGIEIDITSIQCKFKISQNRSDRDQANVRDELEKAGYRSLSNAMEQKS